MFSEKWNTGFLYDIKFLFNRCHRSWDAETPDKYEGDWKILAYTFATSKFLVTEKFTNGALVTPTADLRDHAFHSRGNTQTIDILAICGTQLAVTNLSWSPFTDMV